MDCNKKAAVDHAAFKHFKERCPAVRMDSYPVPGGLLNESIYEGMKGNERLRGADFEFAARGVVLALSSHECILRLFNWLYDCHPIRHHTYAPNDDGIVFPMSIICFRAEGERQIASLRSWLGEIFMPVVWPELILEGMRIIAECKARVSNAESLEELVADRSYLGGDPTSLSFYKTRQIG
ncbi:hypothetical protein [Massilia sp. CT11-137]|uniref:hypothetical protein n=1 Tax=Massilia sp. CT11-137 TaxID=3393901 RepID=UPI0039A44442